MLARAIVGHPRLLLIDGALDGLADEVVTSLCSRLTREDRPWTLLIATGKRCVAEACDRQVSLDADLEREPWSEGCAST
jgi:predicted ABC-type transport system involved in lysophospholipase L1 biosynthesis ATPase subunit